MPLAFHNEQFLCTGMIELRAFQPCETRAERWAARFSNLDWRFSRLKRTCRSVDPKREPALPVIFAPSISVQQSVSSSCSQRIHAYPGEGGDFFPKKEQRLVSICCSEKREELLKMPCSLSHCASSTSCPQWKIPFSRDMVGGFVQLLTTVRMRCVACN